MLVEDSRINPRDILMEEPVIKSLNWHLVPSRPFEQFLSL